MSRSRKPGFGPVDSRIERREPYKVRGYAVGEEAFRGLDREAMGSPISTQRHGTTGSFIVQNARWVHKGPEARGGPSSRGSEKRYRVSRVHPGMPG